MNNNYEKFRAKVFSAMRGLAKECPEFSDAEMLVASSDVTASLKRSTVHKNIDTEWVDRIEYTLPYLDLIVRNPTIMIEDVDEILPVELSRNISEKTIKHLAQHTNMILNITEDDEVIPQKLLNVFHEESLLTYENKFINTLLVRLSVFVDKRYKLLRGGYGTERNYQFRYATEFEHYPDEEGGRNLAKVQLSIDLASPLTVDLSEADLEANDQYKMTLARVQKISNALMSYMSSPYVRALGRNYIRPPVIRTNAILKNKNMKECLNLWEYIESFDKAGYSFVSDEFTEMPSDNYITDLYSSVALQYTNFYNGVAENPEDNRILANRHLSEVYPDFDSSFDLEDLEDYNVYDSEYKKTVPVSRLMNNRKKLSEDERRIRLAIIVALKADELINAEELEREAEERRLAREKRRIEEEERRRAEEEARRRAEEEARRREEEEEARRRAEAEARGPVVIRYRRSFLARYIQAGSFLQDYYTEIKNDLLSYKGVKSRTSWNKETYKRGRQPIAKMDVKGKTLYLWLAMNPMEFENTKYHVTDVSDQRIGEEYPLQMKIRSPRSMKYAKELIAILMERLEIPRIEREFEDFHLPYRETEELIELGLIKVVLPAGVTLDENTQTVKADLRDVFGEGASASENGEAADEGNALVAEPEENETEGEEAVAEYEETEPVTDGEEPATDYEEYASVEEEAIPALTQWEESDVPVEEVAAEEEAVAEIAEEPVEEAAVEEPVEEVAPVAEETVASEESAAYDKEEAASEPQSTEESTLAEEENTVQPLVMDEVEENSLAMVIDQVINSSDEDGHEQYTIVNVSGTARIVRKKATDKNDDFVYAGAENTTEDAHAVVIPYTREQYLALPRKKKKNVLMNVKKMISYRNTLAMLELLQSMNTQNPRILERIQLLEERLAAEAKYLPTAPLWEESVKRLKK